MLKIFIKKQEKFICPADGKIMDITKVQDDVFSQKIMGDGIAIVPTNGKIYAPMSGKLEVCFPTGHAYGIKMKGGREILLHLGIDTVELDGIGFKSYVKQGEYIKQGQLLCEMDLDKIITLGKLTTVMMIFTSGEMIKVLSENTDVIHGEEIIEIVT